MIGLPKSPSFMPVARQSPRAPAMLRPWVVVRERRAGMDLGLCVETRIRVVANWADGGKADGRRALAARWPKMLGEWDGSVAPPTRTAERSDPRVAIENRRAARDSAGLTYVKRRRARWPSVARGSRRGGR